MAQSPSTSQPNIDHLLKIARELEYGLIELAENLPAESALTTETGPVDASGLGGALANLQSDDDLQALRDAVETARQRPRDVDVMLDLVLRAGAIATVIEERDALKAAIEAATGGSTRRRTPNTRSTTSMIPMMAASRISTSAIQRTMTPSRARTLQPERRPLGTFG